LTDQELILVGGFDAFRDDFDLEVVAGAADGAENCLTGATALDPADEAHVELDLIRLQVVEKGEARVGGAEVVDSEADAKGSGILNKDGEMRAVVDDVNLRDFNHDAIGGDTSLLGSFESGENRFRIRVKALRQEIEVQSFVDTESARESHGGDASGLIEEVKIGGRDLVEDLPRRLAPWAANEGLPSNNFANHDVDDGLKGEGEGRIDGELRRGLGNKLRVDAHRVPADWNGDDMEACARMLRSCRGGFGSRFMVPRCPGENHYPNGAELTPLKGYNRAWKWCILTRLALSRGRLVERTDRGETPEIQEKSRKFTKAQSRPLNFGARSPRREAKCECG
jgi:hypothetical protein